MTLEQDKEKIDSVKHTKYSAVAIIRIGPQLENPKYVVIENKHEVQSIHRFSKFWRIHPNNTIKDTNNPSIQDHRGAHW